MRLLLVEDDPFIALDLEMLIEGEGHEVVGAADTYADAITLARLHMPDAAFVDLNLRDGMTGLQIAQTLTQELGLSVVFVTGNAEQIPADFAGASGVAEKPFSHEGIAELLGILQHAREGLAPPATRHVRVARG